MAREVTFFSLMCSRAHAHVLTKKKNEQLYLLWQELCQCAITLCSMSSSWLLWQDMSIKVYAHLLLSRWRRKMSRVSSSATKSWRSKMSTTTSVSLHPLSTSNLLSNTETKKKPCWWTKCRAMAPPCHSLYRRSTLKGAWLWRLCHQSYPCQCDC